MWEPPSHGREIFQFWGSESCNLVHSLVRFLAFYEVSTYCSVFSVPVMSMVEILFIKKKKKKNIYIYIKKRGKNSRIGKKVEIRGNVENFHV